MISPTNTLCLLVLCWLCIGSATDTDSNQDFKLLSHRVTSPVCPRAPQYTCDPTSPFRSINGACNNLQQPWWGQANSPYKRLLSPHYDDRLTEPRTRSASSSHRHHSYLPNARTVANEIFRDSSSKDSKSTWFNLVLPYFAQLVSYDLSATAPSVDRNGQVEKCRCNSRDRDCFNIPTPKDDKKCKDQKCMSLVRSLASVREFDCSLGPREQLNKATHWLDLSFLYGSSQEHANSLRELSGGLLKSFNNTRTGELYFALNQTEQCKYSKYSPRYFDRQRCYITGDPRTEDNAVLTSLVTIFLREHNRIATELALLNPIWTDERLYQESRRIVIAIYQNIIYSEFLPAVIGKEASISFGLPTLQTGYFTRYSSSIYPQVNNEFATAASRFFHTMLPAEHTLVGRNKRDKVSKSISYFQFNNQLYERQMNPLLRGLLTEAALPVKPHMNKYLQDWLWNELFYDEETKRWSLSALNIQQGRDHGLAPYNKYRKLCGLREAKSFHDLTNIPEKIVQELKRVYSSVDDIDLFVGLVSEKPLKNAYIGKTAACIIGKQFRDLKFGDRFYFENADPVITKRDLSQQSRKKSFTPEQLNSIRRVTLDELFANNSGVRTVQPFAFYLPNNNFNRPPSQSINNLNLSLWTSPDGLYFNCTHLLAFDSTTGFFNYSTTNSSADYATFNFDFTSYSASGLPQASIDVKCFPLNRTAILTITGNQASTNLNMDTFTAEAKNCSLLVYIFDMNSTSFYEFYGYSYNSSSIGLTIANVRSQVYFDYYAGFESYDSSSAFFAVDSVDHAYFGNEIYFFSLDNSSVSLTISNINFFEMPNDDVWLETFPYNGLRDGDNYPTPDPLDTSFAYTNQTTSNHTFRFVDIQRAEMYGFDFEWFSGGHTSVLFENLDDLTFTDGVYFNPDYDDSLFSEMFYINIQFSFVARDIRQLTSLDYITLEAYDTFNAEFVFEDIEQIDIAADGFYLDSELLDQSAATNFSVSFRNITSATIYDIGFDQDHSGRIALQLFDIDYLFIEDEIYVHLELSIGSIDFRADISHIGHLQLVDEVDVEIETDGLSIFNFEKIDTFIGQLDLISINANHTFLFSMIDCGQVELNESYIELQSEKTSIVFDRIQNLTIVNETGFDYKADTLSANKSVGQNSLVISNVQLLDAQYVSIDFQNGLSSADFVNISSFVNMTGLTLSSNNSLANFNFGNIPQLSATNVTINKGDNSTTMKWNLDEINSVYIGDLQGTLDGVVNVSLSSVTTTVITNITATIVPTPGLFFRFFGDTDSFDFVNVPGGAGSTIKTVEGLGCLCTGVESFP